MIRIRKSNERGHVDHGWLEAYHTFSFGEYYHPDFKGFRDLRVINEDRVMPGKGFGQHGHRDMEIITYIIEGELEHKDSLGTGSVIRPGDVQRMSAGKGVLHSEFNHSQENKVHLLQIWIRPKEHGIQPSYEEKKFSLGEKKNKFCLLVSPSGENGSLRMHQDAKLFASVLEQSKKLTYTLEPQRALWVQVVRGAVEVNGRSMEAGDGAALVDENAAELTALSLAEVLVFDLP